MREVQRIARAKINLGLDVVAKREDGYHELNMIMETIGLHDKLRIKKIRKKDIILKTNLPYLPTDERNLVYKIILDMKERFDIDAGIFVDLYKVIPVGAGLAGGSADAAQTILGMNELFDLNMTLDEMLDLGVKYGADIPYCIMGGTMQAQGIGELLTPIQSRLNLHLVVVKPKVSVSTPYVFSHLDVKAIDKHPSIDHIRKALENGDLDLLVESMGNVLEKVTFEGYKEVEDIKKAILETHALGALMSGSGSAVFGIYPSEEASKKATRILNQHPSVRSVFMTQTYKTNI